MFIGFKNFYCNSFSYPSNFKAKCLIVTIVSLCGAQRKRKMKANTFKTPAKSKSDTVSGVLLGLQANVMRPA